MLMIPIPQVGDWVRDTFTGQTGFVRVANHTEPELVDGAEFENGEGQMFLVKQEAPTFQIEFADGSKLWLDVTEIQLLLCSEQLN